jgi:translation initiation factor 1 (eIF-1/SUI1)
VLFRAFAFFLVAVVFVPKFLLEGARGQEQTNDPAFSSSSSSPLAFDFLREALLSAFAEEQTDQSAIWNVVRAFGESRGGDGVSWAVLKEAYERLSGGSSEEENKTKKAPTKKKKAMPPAPSRNGKGGVRIKVERRKNKVVTVVTGLENPTKELVTKLKKVLGAGASLDADTCIFQGTHANALEDMIKAMGYKDVKIVK